MPQRKYISLTEYKNVDFNIICCIIKLFIAVSSSGQDGRFSFCKHGFNSRYRRIKARIPFGILVFIKRVTVGFNLFSGSAQSEQRLKLSATCSSGRLTRLPTRKPSQARIARQFPLPPNSFKSFGYHMYLICTQEAFELYILIWIKRQGISLKKVFVLKRVV